MTLRNTTFLIYHFDDSADRARNLLAVCEYLRGERILIWADSPPPHLPENCRIFGHDIRIRGLTHRTKARNELARMADTPIICQLDGDVIPSGGAFEAAEKMIMDRKADFVYPYTIFRRMGNEATLKFCETQDAIDLALSTDYEDTTNIYGGAVFADRKKYFEIGAENENYLSWPGEDKDRWERMTRLGKTKRIDVVLYHLDHARTIQTEGKTSPDRQRGIAELTKVRGMNDADLLAYAQRGFK